MIRCLPHVMALATCALAAIACGGNDQVPPSPHVPSSPQRESHQGTDTLVEDDRSPREPSEQGESEDCTSEIDNASHAMRRGTCNEQGTECELGDCQVVSCDTGFEMDGNACVPSVGAAGCVGDGKTDDTACLQQLIDASDSPVLPAGKTFLVSNTILIGAGKIVDGSNSTILMKSVQWEYQSVLSVQGSDVTIRNVKIDFRAPTWGVGIDLGRGTKDTTIKNNTISGFLAMGVLIDNPDIENVRISDNAFNDVHFGVLTNTTRFSATELKDWYMHPTNIQVTNNKMYNLYADGVSINSPIYNYKPHNSGIPGVSANDITISGNEIDAPNATHTHVGFCISVAGAAHVTITGNSMVNCKWQGIHVEDQAYAVTISGNYISKIIGRKATDVSWWNSGRSGIHVIHSNTIWILDNHIEGTIDSGIQLAYDTNNLNLHNKTIGISQNRIVDAGTYGIQVSAPGGVNIDVYIGPISPLSGNTVLSAGIAPFILRGDPAGVTVIGNSFP